MPDRCYGHLFGEDGRLTPGRERLLKEIVRAYATATIGQDSTAFRLKDHTVHEAFVRTESITSRGYLFYVAVPLAWLEEEVSLREWLTRRLAEDPVPWIEKYTSSLACLLDD